MEDRYIGDGVYASFDGYHIWLKTQQGMEVALEPEAFTALVKYQQDLLDFYRAQAQANEARR